ncbi:MAG: hypothetical protein MUP98_06985 [Candidatus Aminicenantes bacterium]|nr:hypothetical protein [Candidatus Aminicenantes bacterium]
MKKCLFIFILIALTTVFVTADVYIKQKIHTDAINMMGQNQPAVDDFSEMWITENKMAVLSPGVSIIVDMAKKVVFYVNIEGKTYVEMGIPVDFSKYIPDEMAQMGQGMLNTSVTVQPTGESMTINNWKCEGYDVNMDMMMLQMKTKVWASKDVPFDWKDLMSKNMELTKVTLKLNDQSIQEMAKIDGFQIKSETTMNIMGSDMNSYQEVVEISEKPAPAGVYTVPEGFEKQDKLSSADFMKR